MTIIHSTDVPDDQPRREAAYETSVMVERGFQVAEILLVNVGPLSQKEIESRLPPSDDPFPITRLLQAGVNRKWFARADDGRFVATDYLRTKIMRPYAKRLDDLALNLQRTITRHVHTEENPNE